MERDESSRKNTACKSQQRDDQGVFHLNFAGADTLVLWSQRILSENRNRTRLEESQGGLKYEKNGDSSGRG